MDADKSMDANTEIGLRARFADTLRKYQDELAEIGALWFAVDRLTDGVSLTGDPEDTDDAQEAVEIAGILARIAHRQITSLRDEIGEEISRVDVMSEDDPPEGGNPPDEDDSNGAPPASAVPSA